ncbi:GtrA family protein, partial [Kibdelosporangium lantanae]
ATRTGTPLTTTDQLVASPGRPNGHGWVSPAVKGISRLGSMAFVQTIMSRLPEPVRKLVLKHREMLRFAVVGGVCFVVTLVVNYALKLTVLNAQPVTAQAVAVIIATIVSYVLNREWSFHTRGGRERHHEAALFFLISGIGVGLNSAPLWVSRYML